MLSEEITRDTKLFPGDVIEMHFKAFGPNWIYLRAAELAILQYRLEKKNPDWELVSWQAPGDKLILTFKILEPREPTPQVQQAAIGTAGVIAVIVIGGGLFAWLSLDKIYRITKSPAGQVALAGSSLFVVGLVCVVAYFVWKMYPWSD